jgi:hypothetical protein
LCCSARETSASSLAKFHVALLGSMSFQVTYASQRRHVPNGTTGHGVPSAAFVICIPKYLDETAAMSRPPERGGCVELIMIVEFAQPPRRHKDKTAAIAQPVPLRVISFFTRQSLSLSFGLAYVVPGRPVRR